MISRLIYVLVLIAAGCSFSPDKRVVQQADQLLVEGQLEAALEVVNTYLRDHPAAIEVRRQRVLVLLRADQIEMALSEIDQLPVGDPVLVQALAHRNPEVRAGASKVMLERPHALAAKVVVRKMEDPSAVVRQNCARVAGKLKQTLFLKPLFRLLQDPDWQVRSEAADALGAIGDPQAAGWLIVRLRDTDRFVQFRAAQALRAVVCEANRDVVARAMLSRKQKNTFEIAVALAKLGDERALGPLTAAIRNPDRDVRRRAAEALGVCGQPIATNALLQLLTDEELTVRDEARVALKKLTAPVPPAL